MICYSFYFSAQGIRSIVAGGGARLKPSGREVYSRSAHCWFLLLRQCHGLERQARKQ